MRERMQAMEYKRIELDRVARGTPDSDRYVFTYRPEPAELASSIAASGVLVPPLLQEEPNGLCRIVCGSRRIKALRTLGRKSVHAFVSPTGEMTEADWLSRSILENRWHRGFNEVEKALLFTGLTDRFPRLLPELRDVLGPDLHVPQDEKALDPYRFLLSLSEPVQRAVAGGELALAQALLLGRIPASARPGFFHMMIECGLTAQEARQALAWVQEIAGREARTEAEVLGDEAIQGILKEGTDPRRKARLLFSHLSRQRQPLLESWKARFASVRSRITAQDESIRVSHDPTFETTQIRVQIQASSEDEFDRRLTLLADALRQGKIRRLFEALSVESG